MPITTGQVALAADVLALERHIATGSYTGNGANRQITVGFKCTLVIILSTDANAGDLIGILIPNMAMLDITTETTDYAQHGVALHASDGFVPGVNNTVFNYSGDTYYYWAISE